MLIDGPVVFKKKNLEEREQWEEEELKGPPNRKARRLHLQPEGAALTKGGGVFSLARENEPGRLLDGALNVWGIDDAEQRWPETTANQYYRI